ncbi:DUF4145 domain-containing protein [Xenophilus azovorans]|uniref:DUF4145 domain-containing protein n=1 Tax=Xenophilus azovorans TaxID=151755 RepID=UPI0005717943|nr:DUF4145 domain-containing protein [Xenophilus azovorans]
MNPSLEDFCEIVGGLQKKTNAEKALALLWYHDQEQPNIAMTAGRLTRLLSDHHIGSANSVAVGDGIRKSKLAVERSAGFVLKPGSRKLIRAWLPEHLEGVQPTMDHGAGFLPEPVWRSNRGYIEAVCRELNGCYRAAYYNAAAVMLRRLLETLIIEAYEHLGREAEIRDGAGNYFMLADLVERACGEKGHLGINLGRDAKTALKDARQIGNWAAHARRFIAHAPDLTKLQSGARILVQELIQIANIGRA